MALGAVVWVDVLVMVVGSVAGGYAGARLAYRVGRPVVRKLVVAVGLLMSVALFVAR